MTATAIWTIFLENVRQTHPAEWVSTGMQVASVWYAAKNKVLVYPTGIIGVLLAAWLYFFKADPPLYADALLNVYYFIMSIYGWYNWVQKKNNDFIYPVQWCTVGELVNGIFIFLISWMAIYFLLRYITDSNTPVLDSLVSSSAVTSMWWMAKRKMENWIAWIISNIVAIPLNFYKGFMLFTLMYVLFLGMAIGGFVAWRRMVKR